MKVKIDYEKTAELLMMYLKLVLDERYTKDMMIDVLKRSIKVI